MGFGDKVFFFFSALGVFNGLMLSVYFLFFTAKKNLSNYFLGSLLLMLSIRIGKSVAYFFDYNLPKTYLQIGLTACFFIGPFLYYYIKAETQRIRKLPRSWMWQAGGWLLMILLVGVVYPYQHFPSLWGRYIVPLIYLQWGIYIAFSFLLVIPLMKKVTRGESAKPFELWILVICGGVALLFASYVWAILNITQGSYITGAILFSILIYLVVFTLLYRKKASDLSSFSVQKYGDKKFGDDEVQFVIEKLKRVMAEKELYKNPNLKIHDVAREIHVSGHQLSQILNNNLEKNFTLFVNEYRIREACRILSERTRVTLDAVSDEVGFNAKSTFFSAFKKITGQTPGAYQQQTTPDL